MKLTNCSDVSLSVFAYFISRLLLENDGCTLARGSGEDAGSERTDISRTHSSGGDAWTDEASRDSFSKECDENHKYKKTIQLTLGNGVFTALFRGGRSECKSPLRGCLLSRRHQRTHDLRSRADIPESLLKPVSTSDKGSCPLSCSSDCNDADGTLSDMSCSNSG